MKIKQFPPRAERRLNWKVTQDWSLWGTNILNTSAKLLLVPQADVQLVPAKVLSRVWGDQGLLKAPLKALWWWTVSIQRDPEWNRARLKSFNAIIDVSPAKGFDTPAALVNALSQKCVMFHRGTADSGAVGGSGGWIFHVLFFFPWNFVLFDWQVLKKKHPEGRTLYVWCRIFVFFSFYYRLGMCWYSLLVSGELGVGFSQIYRISGTAWKLGDVLDYLSHSRFFLREFYTNSDVDLEHFAILMVLRGFKSILFIRLLTFQLTPHISSDRLVRLRALLTS